jgi:hypothetical protein
MTDLYVFSKMDMAELNGGGESLEEEPQIIVGGLSVSELLKRKSNDLSDSKLYSFFENLAIPIGLSCYKNDIERSYAYDEKGESNDGVIKNDLFDRLFNISSINLARGKARRTRKKIP